MKLNYVFMKEFFKKHGYATTIDKKNARILYQLENGKIFDLIVEEFINPGDNHHLYRVFSRDIGNCLSDWEKWTLADVLMATFISYEIPFNLRKKVLFELSKIKEFRPDLYVWLYKNFSGD